MENMKNKIYARLNEKNVVIKLFSSVFEQPMENDLLVEEGNEEHHAHVHLKYQLMDMNGDYNYKFENEKMVELTDEEKAKLFPVVEVDPVEPLEDQVKTLKSQIEIMQQDMADILLSII